MINNKNNEAKKLSKYYVAYIDILGATEMIESNKSEEYLRKINNLYQDTINMIKSNCQNLFNIKATVKIFSDNILIAIPKIEFFGDSTNDMSSCYILIFSIFFQILAMYYGILVRGSITIGDLYIDDIFVYGNALTKAHSLESNIANYPRIIINPKVINEFMHSDFQEKIIQKDSSNIYYINPFECYFNEFCSTNKEHYLFNANEKLQTLLAKNNNDNINQKVCWFINLFNDFCKKNNHPDYVINIDDYPYPTKVEKVIYTGKARELV